jgi:Secretion system C-terminal sorting domain
MKNQYIIVAILCFFTLNTEAQLSLNWQQIPSPKVLPYKITKKCDTLSIYADSTFISLDKGISWFHYAPYRANCCETYRIVQTNNIQQTSVGVLEGNQIWKIYNCQDTLLKTFTHDYFNSNAGGNGGFLHTIGSHTLIFSEFLNLYMGQGYVHSLYVSYDNGVNWTSTPYDFEENYQLDSSFYISNDSVYFQESGYNKPLVFKGMLPHSNEMVVKKAYLDQKLFVFRSVSFDKTEMLYSENQGTTWQSDTVHIKGIITNFEKKGNRYYLRSQKALYYSDNPTINGFSKVIEDGTNMSQDSIAWHYEEEDFIFICKTDGEVLRTDDAGLTWETYNFPSRQERILDLKSNGIDKFYQPTQLYNIEARMLGDTNYVLYNSNIQFNTLETPFTKINNDSFDFKFLNYSGCWKSTKNNNAYVLINQANIGNNPFYRQIETDGDTIFQVFDDNLFYSLNNGNFWSEVDLPSGGSKQLKFSQGDWFMINNQHFYLSSNEGQNWLNMDTILQLQVVKIQKRGKLIYILAQDTQQNWKVLKWNTLLKEWIIVGDDLNAAINQQYCSDNFFIISSENDSWIRSSEGNWKLLNLPFVKPQTWLNDGENLYVGTEKLGLWKATDLHICQKTIRFDSITVDSFPFVWRGKILNEIGDYVDETLIGDTCRIFYLHLKLQSITQQLGIWMDKLFLIFPNPADSKVYVDISELQGKKTQITLLNQLGQVVDEKSLDIVSYPLISFDLSSFNSGQYFIKIATQGQRTQVKRLIINRMY